MSQSLPLQTHRSDQTSAAVIINPKLIPDHHTTIRRQQWEDAARVWLASLPHLRDPSAYEIDAWIDFNRSSIPEDVRSLPRTDLHQRILSLRLSIPIASQAVGCGQVEFPYRFQRTDQWLPVYKWLESLDKDMIVNSKEITDWLSSNTEFRDSMLVRHSRYHLMHYIQKLHLKLLKKKGKLPKGMLLSTARASVKSFNGVMARNDASLAKPTSSNLKDDGTFSSKRNEAFLDMNYLQKQLTSILSQQNGNSNVAKGCMPSLHNPKQEHHTPLHSSDIAKKDEGEWVNLKSASSSPNAKRNSTTQTIAVANIGHKRRRDPIILTTAWSYSEAYSDITSSHYREGRKIFHLQEDYLTIQTLQHAYLEESEVLHGHYLANMVVMLEGTRKGWRSLECQFEGLAMSLKRRSYSSWAPTWCAYTSGAIVQPHGRQGVQKVLNVRFHPEGLPQLVCGSNEAPNELLLYNLLSGKAIQLVGHGCEIKAVDFAVRGASIVSCGSNMLKQLPFESKFSQFRQLKRLHLFHLATVAHTFVPLALSNSTLVWDTRLMPTNVQQMHLGRLQK
ncbi:hypothetical protein HPP92_011766 [Vanilla planifolia]|uniref:Uncharacterized protein n=1 Tax=Vanilla planifolia TaxID=51239 RepID=A0A835V121_VANPL|nr:hypothetical protein HPP92_011766 [Vanilla planifolia]